MRNTMEIVRYKNMEDMALALSKYKNSEISIIAYYE